MPQYFAYRPIDEFFYISSSPRIQVAGQFQVSRIVIPGQVSFTPRVTRTLTPKLYYSRSYGYIFAIKKDLFPLSRISRAGSQQSMVINWGTFAILKLGSFYMYMFVLHACSAYIRCL